MDTELFENTKIAAYFLWEYSQHDNALALWQCAEDLGCYFDRMEYYAPENIKEIKMRGIYNYSYIQFVRNIAFTIYIYTGQTDSKWNWYTTEKLIQNHEWYTAITRMAQLYNQDKSKIDFIDGLRSEKIKNYYRPYTEV